MLTVNYTVHNVVYYTSAITLQDFRDLGGKQRELRYFDGPIDWHFVDVNVLSYYIHMQILKRDLHFHISTTLYFCCFSLFHANKQ